MIIVWWALHSLSCKTLINLHSCKCLHKEQSHEKADPKQLKDLSFLMVPFPTMYYRWTHKKNLLINMKVTVEQIIAPAGQYEIPVPWI